MINSKKIYPIKCYIFYAFISFIIFILNSPTIFSQNLYKSSDLLKVTSDIIFIENFEDNALDSMVTIETIGSFQSSPSIKEITNFGSTKGFGFGRSTCSANCFNNYVTKFIINLPLPTHVTILSFKEMELYSNWGSKGKIYIDGETLTTNYQDFGRIPSNDRTADNSYRFQEYEINRKIQTIEIRVWDITRSSEIFIDDILVLGFLELGFFRISRIFPNNGGDIGVVSTVVHGELFMEGAEVKLTNGSETIDGEFEQIYENGHAINTSFDLKGHSIGQYDVIVTNPNGETVTLDNGFTVENGRPADVWVDILGRDVIRVGRRQSYNILFGNRGNVDAIGAHIWITGIPKDADVELNFDYVNLNPSQTSVPYVTDNEKIIPLHIFNIPAGITRSLLINLTVPNSEKFELKVFSVTL